MAAITADKATGCLMGQPACNAGGLVPTFGDLDEPLFALYSEMPSPCGGASPSFAGNLTVSAAVRGGNFSPAPAFGTKRGCCH